MKRCTTAAAVAGLMITVALALSACVSIIGQNTATDQSNTDAASPPSSSQSAIESGVNEDAPNPLGLEKEPALRIAVRCNETEIVYVLNDSTAARDLFEQLPLELEVEPFSDNEMTVYPPNRLDVDDAPLAGSGGRGSLAYYEPWGDLVFFYGGFSGNASLFSLGIAESGSEFIEGMRGTATIEAL